MVGSLPVGEGDTGSGPSPGGSSMPRGSWALGSRLLSLRSGAREPQLLSPRAWRMCCVAGEGAAAVRSPCTTVGGGPPLAVAGGGSHAATKTQCSQK